jgi:LPS sulfotransferase NodH
MKHAISYVIASIQRSGTHLLCSILRSTGVVGSPDEHFLSKPGETWEKRWGGHRASPMCNTFYSKIPHLMESSAQCNVELFRTNAPDVAGNSGIQKS